MLAALLWTLVLLVHPAAPLAHGSLTSATLDQVSTSVRIGADPQDVPAWMLSEGSPFRPTLDEEDEDTGDTDDDLGSPLHDHQGWARHGSADHPGDPGLGSPPTRRSAAPPPPLSPLAVSARLRR